MQLQRRVLSQLWEGAAEGKDRRERDHAREATGISRLSSADSAHQLQCEDVWSKSLQITQALRFTCGETRGAT